MLSLRKEVKYNIFVEISHKQGDSDKGTFD